MAGRGKGGKALGMAGVKRHRKVLRDNISGITRADIRRLGRRGGVKRISGLMYTETRDTLRSYLEDVIHDASAYTEHARRKTLKAIDVVHVLKRQGRTLYGFGYKTFCFRGFWLSTEYLFSSLRFYLHVSINSNIICEKSL